MQKKLLVAMSCAALTAAVAAPAFAAPQSAYPAQPAAAAQADAVSDAELRNFATAMEAVRPIAEASGGTPSPEQQAQMAEAITGTGLELERFNAISTVVANDAVVRARAQLAGTDPSPAGSPAAAVTDTEVEQFVVAMAGVQPIAESLDGAAPSTEQQAQMAAAITGSGLELERFNAISGTVSQDAHLNARMAVAEARRGS